MLGEKSYSLKIIWGEDLVTSFVLFRVARSFKFIGKYGIFRYKNKKTASNNTPFKLYALSLVLYLDVVFDFTKNTVQDKKYVVFIAMEFFKNIKLIQALDENEKSFLNSILQKILKCNYIDEIDKKRIQNNFNKYNRYGIITNINR